MQSRFLHTHDTQTWNAFRQGNQAAFGYIYHTYFRALYSYGRKFSQDDTLLGDTLQQLFTELWHKRKKLGATDNIKNYLYKSFRRALLREIKKSSKKAWPVSDSSFGIVASHEAQLIDQQQREKQQATLQQAVKLLTANQREVIHLRFYDGLSYAEISEIMETNPSQVYDFMYKALKVLRKKLKQESSVTSSLTLFATILFLLLSM